MFYYSIFISYRLRNAVQSEAIRYRKTVLNGNSKRFLLFERIWKALIPTIQKEIEEHYSLIPRDQKFHCVVIVFPIGHATLHLSYITANNLTM